MKADVEIQFPGPQGVPGPRGYTGPQGDQGDQGVQGVQGEQGVQGDVGPQGDTGPQGERGLKGDTGDKGDKGDTGAAGLDGADGPTGPDGRQGVQGIQGETGTQGIQGPQGEIGPQGEQGIRGLQGIDGPKGDQGDTGAQGIQGDIGPQGDRGSTGAAFSIQGTKATVGDLPGSGSEGQAWIVDADGDLYVWDVQGLHWSTVGQIVGPEGPQGIQGIQGERGPNGDQGTQGVKGDTGIQGIQGERGIQGPQGDQGIKGDQGDQGVQGIQGVDGPKGDQGIQGIQGFKGDTGDTGATGAAGVTYRGVWDSGTTYAVDDIVQYNGSTYITTSLSLGDPPDSPGIVSGTGGFDVAGAPFTGRTNLDTWMTQPFQVAHDMTLTKVRLYPNTYAGLPQPMAAVTVQLRATLTGAAVATGTVPATSSSAGSECTLSVPVALTAGVTYYLNVHEAGGPGVAVAGDSGYANPGSLRGEVSSRAPGVYYGAGGTGSGPYAVMTLCFQLTGTVPGTSPWQTLAAKGDTGATGANGADGVDGVDGAVGPAGPTGAVGVLSLTEVEVDFGVDPVWSMTFTVADAEVFSFSKVIVFESGNTATDRVGNDAEWDSLMLSARGETGAVSVTALALPGPVVGKRKIYYQAS